MTDLPLLAAQASPRRIHLAGARDAANAPVSLEEMRRIYPGPHIRVSSEAAWSEGVLGD